METNVRSIFKNLGQKAIQVWQKNFDKKIIPFILIGLTFLFFFDDLFLIYLVKELQLFSLSGIYYAALLIALFLMSIGLAFVVLKILQKKPQTGKEGLIEKEGLVINKDLHTYNVAVQGEIWQAVCDENLSVGAKVRIISVDSLTLTVKKET